MSMMRRGVMVAMAVGALAACGGSEQPAAAQDSAPDAAMAATDTGAEAMPASEPAAPAGFDLAAVPVSDHTLGAFPFIALPTGYEAINEQTLNIARVPFWTGDRLENVEGKAYLATIQEQSGHTYSDLELERNVQHVIEQAGGVLVTDSAIAPDLLEGVSRDVRKNLVDGWGDVYNNPVQTYVIRGADKTVWLHLCADSAGAGMIIVEAKPFEATASLLPADALKREIDANGKVAMQVNFAVDKADILPGSMPQIEQVANLLNNDPALKLSIDGHTDATGDAGHNQALSEARAKSVVAALVARGIDGGRLQARGLGQSEPVADNATEQGRAKNRRVELVRI
ncbi:OmpA family protein [Marilutibacter maris]|uniref:Flagellar motor protein MotB n=1 Tax=Marilutibacter maris TaxID=1605891 RepID=A0A2U9T064_9GAMM|nr:OmpA family protein [Lysobacter maris]AWV05813.1 flagellar motor protein MotB [Lysobacter maris]